MKKSEWTMLEFSSLEAAAGFINALPDEIRGDLEKVRVGINCINVRSSVYADIQGEFGPDKFSYVVRQ